MPRMSRGQSRQIVVAVLMVIGILILLLIAAETFGEIITDEPIGFPDKTIGPQKMPTILDAVAWASEDVSSRPSPHTMFYIFLPRTSKQIIGAHVYALNLTINNSNTELRDSANNQAGVRAPVVTTNRGHLLAVDLGVWCPKPSQMRRVREAISKGLFDPFFYNRSVVQVTVENPAPTEKDKRKVVIDTVDESVIAPHAAIKASVGDQFSRLAEACKTDIPIVHGDLWLSKSLDSVDGGIYYDLRGFTGKSEVEYLKMFGADLTASSAVSGDSMAATFRSGVTGKPRRAVAFFGIGTSPTRGVPIHTMTQDVDVGTLDPSQHPIYSLDTFKYAASEHINVLPFGLPAAALFNSEGVIQTSVPVQIAHDPHIPFPYDRRLRPIISCLRCHGIEAEGWQPFPNDVKTLFDSGELRLAAQNGNGENGVVSTVARYSGDLSEPLAMLRSAANVQSTRVSGMGTKDVSQVITDIVAAYQYQPVTPSYSMRSLGWDYATDAEAVEHFRRLVPRDGVVDPTFAALRAWSVENPIQVTILDWERVFPAALLRVIESNGTDENDNSQDGIDNARAGDDSARRQPEDKAKE